MTERDAPKSSGAKTAASAVLSIVVGIAVFIGCALVQAAGDSSMFETGFSAPGNAVLEVAMQVTFWPGWMATAYFVGTGILGLLGRDR